ncbi:MAG: hypothetical protein K2H14_09875 [Muribaculaceae bacterium]|nr:hypothetical protein [Muribaculaceae bacterium]
MRNLLLLVALASTVNMSGAPEGQWTSVGPAVYHEDLMTCNVDVKPGHSWVVGVEQNQDSPGWYRFQPYISHDCYVAQIMTYTDDAYVYINATDPEKVYIEDFEVYDDYMFSSLVPENGWTGSGDFYGTLTDDVISFRPLSIGLYDADYDMWYPASKTNGFKLELGKSEAHDYVMSVRVSTCASDGYIFYKPDAGSDIWTVKAVVKRGGFKAEYYDEAAVAGEEVNAGETSQFKAPERGRYTVAVVGLDRAGNVVARDFTYGYTYDRDDNGVWQSVGKVNYTEDFAASRYLDIESVTYEVELERLQGVDGYFRIVDPYREHPVLRLDYPDHAMHDHFIYINATDPSAIYIEDCPIGLELGGGDISVSSVAASMLSDGATVDQVRASGDYFGHVDDAGMLTFSEGALLIGEKSRNKGEWAVAAKNFKIELPGVSASVNTVEHDKTDAVSAVYNLNGMPVADNAGPGIYIMKTTAGMKKVVVK